MNKYLLDTNIWSAIIRRRSPDLLQRFSELQANQVYMSVIVFGELLLGYYKGDQTPQRKAVIDQLSQRTTHLIIDDSIAERYAQLRAQLEKAGTPIGRNDTWIAAEALHHGFTLVTDNVDEFKRVKGLKVENWL